MHRLLCKVLGEQSLFVQQCEVMRACVRKITLSTKHTPIPGTMPRRFFRRGEKIERVSQPHPKLYRKTLDSTLFEEKSPEGKKGVWQALAWSFGGRYRGPRPFWEA